MLANTSADYRALVENFRPFGSVTPLATLVPTAGPEVIALLSIMLQMGELAQVLLNIIPELGIEDTKTI